MRRRLARYRGPLIIVVLLVLPVLFLYASARGQMSGGRLGEAVHWVTSPIQSAVSGTWLKVGESFERYFWLIGIAEDNKRLLKQVRDLRLQLKQADEQRRLNRRLQRLLQLNRALPGVRTVTARVIAVGESPSYKSIRIDRGRADGVRRRAGVITVEGVVGRVVLASRHWADVLMLVDSGSRLDVLVARSRARGMMRGAGQSCRIEAMDRTVDVKVGDQLLTSGFDGVFPKGVPVGRVTEVTRPSMGLYLDARVQPFAPVSRLEEVQVLIAAPDDLAWPRLGGSQPIATSQDEEDITNKPTARPEKKTLPSLGTASSRPAPPMSRTRVSDVAARVTPLASRSGASSSRRHQTTRSPASVKPAAETASNQASAKKKPPKPDPLPAPPTSPPPETRPSMRRPDAGLVSPRSALPPRSGDAGTAQ